MQVTLKVTVMVFVLSLVACAVMGVWAPSAVLASDALIEAREDQMRSNTISTGNRILRYFQAASKMSTGFAKSWNYSAVVNPSHPQEEFIETYGRAVWSQLDQPELTSLLISFVEDPVSMCGIGGLVLSSKFLVMMGTRFSYQNNSNCSTLDFNACRPGTAKITRVGGASTPDPLTPLAHLFSMPCLTVAEFWSVYLQKGSAENLDTVLPRPEWGAPVPVGSPPVAIYKQIKFPIRAPGYPKSGFGALGIRVGRSAVLGIGGVSLQDLLEEAAAVTKIPEILFLLTSSGLLAASSLPEQLVEVRDNTTLFGLTTADNTSMVAESIASLSSEVFNKYCQGTRNCDWNSHFKGGVEVLGSRRVSLLSLFDDVAGSSLDLLLVMSVSESEIVKPATELNETLVIVSCSILACFAAAAVLLGWLIATPVTVFTDKIHQCSLMEIEDLEPGHSSLSEIEAMNQSLVVLVEHLVLYKSFLPTLLLKDTTVEDDIATSDEMVTDSAQLTVSGSEKRSSGSSRSPSAGRRKVEAVSIRRKSGVVLMTNIRNWTESEKIIDPEHLLQSQTEYISFLTTVSLRGTLDYVNGDRCIISFLRNSASHIACNNALSVRQQSSFPTEELAISIAHSQLLIGVIGVPSYRSMQLCGTAISKANRILNLCSLRSDSCVIAVDECVVTLLSTQYAFIVSGIYKLSGDSKVSTISDLLYPLPGCGNEWMSATVVDENQNDVLARYSDCLYQQATHPSPEAWKAFSEAADSFLSLSIETPCRDHVEMTRSSVEVFSLLTTDSSFFRK